MDITTQVERAQAIVAFAADKLDTYDLSSGIALSLIRSIGTDSFEGSYAYAYRSVRNNMERANFLRRQRREDAESAFAALAKPVRGDSPFWADV